MRSVLSVEVWMRWRGCDARDYEDARMKLAVSFVFGLDLVVILFGDVGCANL